MEAVLQGNVQGNIPGKKLVREYINKHDKPVIKKGMSKAVLRKIIAAELVLAVALSCLCVLTYWNRLMNKHEKAVITSFTEFDTQNFAAMAGHSINAAEEEVKKEVDQTVWATDGVYFRTGAGTEYEPAGSLDKWQGMQRTGVTYNGWSQVVIDNEEYYVYSDFLTTEAPLITATGAKGEYQRYALSLLPEFGWAESEITPLISLWNRESGWNPNAHNGGSGAHGIPQALPASKMAAYGSDYYTNGKTQIRWGLNYIAGRYGSPSGAWAHFRSHNWY